MIVFDPQIDKPAWLAITVARVMNSAVYLIAIDSIDVVDCQGTQIDVTHVAIVDTGNMHSAPFGFAGACVGDLQVLDFPVLLIFQKHRVFRLTFAMDNGFWAFTILIDSDGKPISTGTLWPELALPGRTCFEQDFVTGRKDGRIHLRQAFPGGIR